MAITIRKKGDASAVTVTFRFDSRLHFGLELLGRKQHRSLNSVVEWAIARLIDDPNQGLGGKTLDEVWDQEEPDRIVNLAQKYPSLLGPHWERVWKAIREDRSLWLDAQTPNIKKIRTQWVALKERHFYLEKRKKESK